MLVCVHTAAFTASLSTTHKPVPRDTCEIRAFSAQAWFLSSQAFYNPKVGKLFIVLEFAPHGDLAHDLKIRCAMMSPLNFPIC